MNIRCRLSPAALEGHSACVVSNSMFVFGGSTDGAPQNSLWQFDFGQYYVNCLVNNKTLHCIGHWKLTAVVDEMSTNVKSAVIVKKSSSF